MGGTAPVCPFCKKLLKDVGGIKPHVKIQHPDKYAEWIQNGQQPYWRYTDGVLKVVNR